MGSIKIFLASSGATVSSMFMLTGRAVATASRPFLSSVPPSRAGIRENFILPGHDGKDRFIRVHLPPDYLQKPARRYPLLLMQDGQNLFEDETAYNHVSWRLGAALMDGRRSGVLRDVIALGIDNANSFEGRAWEYAPWEAEIEGLENKLNPGGGADVYLDWVEKTVLPEIERRYRIEPGIQNRVIGGASMGGLVSLYALLKKPHLFGGALLLSATLGWPGFKNWFRQNGLPAADKNLWMGAGQREPNGDHAKDVKAILEESGQKEGMDFGFFLDPDADHNEWSWRARVNDWTGDAAENRIRNPLHYFFGA